MSEPTVLMNINETADTNIDESNDVNVTDIVADSYVGDEPLDEVLIDRESDNNDISLMLEAMNNKMNDFPFDIYEPPVATTSRKNTWKIDDDNLCTEVHLNYADKYNLEKAKQVCQLTIASVKEYLNITDDPSISECIELFLQRDWYFMIESLINNNLNNKDSIENCTIPEVFQLQRVWLLQMIEKQTSNTLFDNEGGRWGHVNYLDIKKKRYNTLMKSFKTVKDETLISTDVYDDDDETVRVHKVWGNLLQQQELPKRLEDYFGLACRKFLYESVTDVTIDDDKLRHSSKKFREAGLQMSGFRGSRIGPVMNGLASVHSGIVHSIHFNRHGDNPLSIT